MHMGYRTTPKMFYDYFTNEYVLRPENDEPPERYLLTMRSPCSRVYTERYKSGQLYLDVAYTQAELDAGLVNRIRFAIARENNYQIETATMIQWYIPPEKFDAYWKSFIGEEAPDAETALQVQPGTE